MLCISSATIAVQRTAPDITAATRYYQQALALAQGLRMRPLLAHLHYGIGMLASSLDQRVEAVTALSTAVDLYRAMGMTFWLPEAEAALTQVGGVEKTPRSPWKESSVTDP